MPLLFDFIAAFGENPMVLPDGRISGSTRADWPLLLAVFEREGWDATWNPDHRPVALEDLLVQSRVQSRFAPPVGTSVELERLAAMHSAGHLTAEEFAAAKARILGL